jgi:integrase
VRLFSEDERWYGAMPEVLCGDSVNRLLNRRRRPAEQLGNLGILATAEAEQERLIGTEPTSPKSEGAHAFMILMLMTGLRIGELIGLKWTDLDGQTLRIQRAVSRGHGRHHILA